MNVLRSEWEKSKDLSSLEENLKEFLKHQENRDERIGVTGWKKLATALQTSLLQLHDTVAGDLADVLKKTSEKATAVSVQEADSIKYFFEDPVAAVKEQRVLDAKYYLVKNFLACLYALHRAREVLERPLSSGELYSQGDCHVDF